MKNLLFILLMLFTFQSCLILQKVETNKNIKSCLLVMKNKTGENICIDLNGVDIPISKNKKFEIRLPEGKHKIHYNGKTSLFYGKNLVTYKKKFKNQTKSNNDNSNLESSHNRMFRFDTRYLNSEVSEIQSQPFDRFGHRVGYGINRGEDWSYKGFCFK